MKTYTMYKDHILRDKEEKCNIKLLDIIQAVKDGDEFVVINQENQDLTEETINAAMYKHLKFSKDCAISLIKELYEVN